ncbi:MAG: phosphatase PAP2 family protein [Anaerovoracaceae bacterium]|jgi:undecaprenyl-diphosphatase
MKKIKILIPVLGLSIFTILSIGIHYRTTLFFDVPLLDLARELRSEHLTAFFTFITYCGNKQTIALICLVALLNPRWKKDYGYFLSISAILSTLIYHMLKTLIKRPRPQLMSHLIIEQGYGFPSGHTMTSIVFFGIMIYLLRLHYGKKEKKICLTITTASLSILIFLIPLSRIYLGVHYPSDILAGMALGVSLLFVMIEVHKKILKG